MPQLEPDRQRQFAVDVVRRLREAGFVAYWAGGCVRDQLLGRAPKDYDVATDATPPQIREVFGRRCTLAIGAAFGVITVLGPKQAGQIEVATFRRDAPYSDGRHPDSVTFSTAEEDASRRDFTVNGLFYDPIREQVIDFVGGREDLAQRVIRAIGNPRDRFGEDRLRMLRAVRFTATFGFALDADTLAAVREMAGEITMVSPERIAMEMRQMLAAPGRGTAVRLLVETGLAEAILPEAMAAFEPRDGACAVARRASRLARRRASPAVVHRAEDPHRRRDRRPFGAGRGRGPGWLARHEPPRLVPGEAGRAPERAGPAADPDGRGPDPARRTPRAGLLDPPPPGSRRPVGRRDRHAGGGTGTCG
jgi:poly(A) polymerase